MLPELVLVGLAAGLVATTLTQSKAFRWLQTAVKTVPVLGELMTCAYCMGHWTALAGVLLWWPDHDGTFAQWVIVWASVTAVAAVTSGLIGRLHAD